MKKPGIAAIILSGLKKDKGDSEEESSDTGSVLWDAIKADDKESFLDALGAYIHECVAEYEESEPEEG